MKNVVFSVYDRKAGLYGLPFYQVNRATGIRYFKQICKNQKDISLVEDLDLYEIGTFDLECGTITPYQSADFITTGSEVLNA